MRQRLSVNRIDIAGILAVLAIVLSACILRPDERPRPDGPKRGELPVLTTDSVMTLISDSGVTRYRIESPQWLVYDKTDPPYQEFPKGIYLEQFDIDLSVQASLKADYAYYDENAQQWRAPSWCSLCFFSPAGAGL